MGRGLLVDVTRCIGCGLCRAACTKANGLPARADDDLSAARYTALRKVELGGEGRRWVRRLCMHCLEPACAAACPVGAVRRTAAGPVVWDESRCMGCRYCMLACPFGVPRYEWSAAAPRIRKCILCAPRVARGERTACAGACPMGATVFGERADLLAEAHRRIREAPAFYRPEVFGECVSGGTSVLFLADVAFPRLGFPVDIQDRPPTRRVEPFLSTLPGVGLAAGGLLLGVAWVIRRRQARAKDGETVPAPVDSAPQDEESER